MTSVLSVLLMGVFPVLGGPASRSLLPGDLTVASPSPLRAFEPSPALAVRGHVSASGIVIMDLLSGQTIYDRGARQPRPMASLTKLMTALIIVEGHELTEVVTVPRTIARTDGSTVRLTPGDHFTVGDLLSALLIHSANDAAVTLAAHHSGSLEVFVREMNERAQSLGLRDTVYANVDGLDARGQRSTPRDIALLATFAFREDAIRSRMEKRGAQIRSKEGRTIYLTNTHALLHGDNAVFAGKTGTTIAAGQCLLSFVSSRGRPYVVVIMNSLQRYKDMRAIIDALAASLV